MRREKNKREELVDRLLKEDFKGSKIHFKKDDFIMGNYKRNIDLVK